MGEKPTELDESAIHPRASQAGMVSSREVSGIGSASELSAGDVNADGPIDRRHDASMSSIGNVRRETGGSPSPGEPLEASNLNLSKSNIDRQGAPGDAGQDDLADSVNLNSSKSNAARAAQPRGAAEQRVAGEATESPGPAQPSPGPAEPGGPGPAHPGGGP